MVGLFIPEFRFTSLRAMDILPFQCINLKGFWIAFVLSKTDYFVILPRDDGDLGQLPWEIRHCDSATAGEAICGNHVIRIINLSFFLDEKRNKKSIRNDASARS